MEAIVDSSIETSMKTASRSGFESDAVIPSAAVIPQIVSAIGNPTLNGPDSSLPVTGITPDNPWMIWS